MLIEPHDIMMEHHVRPYFHYKLQLREIQRYSDASDAHPISNKHTLRMDHRRLSIFVLFPNRTILFKTAQLSNLGVEVQLSYFRNRKCLLWFQNCFLPQSIAHQYVCSRPHVCDFLRIFPPVRLFKTVHLSQSIEYLISILS